MKPEGLSAEVDLQNLFGTPAEDRRVVAHLVLSPQPPAFRRYPDFTFFDPAKGKQTYTEDLSEAHTDKDGRATFALDLAKYERATYRLTFAADGFEAEGGRAVSTESAVLVSPFDYLIGTKADGDLGYVTRGATRKLTVLAVDPQLQPKAVAGLKAVLLDQRYVSVLTRQPNGTFRYVSTLKEITLGGKPLSLEAKPTTVTLDTKTPGNFVLSIRDLRGAELARVPYSVAGQANLSRALDRNAELQVKLDRRDYAAGDTIQVAITAPYSGAGLITLERDHVYAARWFKTDTTSSVQTIAVPKDLAGNGYVNVSFVRALDSPEVFMSPLSTAVIPFSVSRAARTDTLTLTAPALVKPGQQLEVSYQVDHPGRIVIFGVDEGILQVARHQNPDPLSYFFRKKALGVSSAQILDLLLPEFSRLALASSAGGDEGAGALGKNLNPFKRKRDKPVVFWSGIREVGPGGGKVRYQVPESFNGQIRVLAVAVSPPGASAAVGAASAAVTVRGPFVLSPNVPTFAAPGDEVQVSVGVANNVDGSGANAPVSVTLAVTAGLEILDGAERKLTIGEGRESSATFKLRATQKLGSAQLTFSAADGGAHAKLATDLSVRPAAPYLVKAKQGVLKSGQAELAHARKMFPEERKLTAAASHLPLGLAGGMVAYLQSYPYGCTEQVVSQAFPALVLQDRPEFGYSAERVAANLERAFPILGERRSGDGAFGMWAANSLVSNFQTAYAAHFLTEAKARARGAPRQVLDRALQYLATLSGEDVHDLGDGREHAYALYVLARNGKSVGGAAAALQKRLEGLPQVKDVWRTDLAGVYLAATYALLHEDALADALVKGLALGQPVQSEYSRYYDGLVRDGQLLFIFSEHFPKKLKALSAEQLQTLAEVTKYPFMSLSAASAILGFDGLARQLAGDLGANAPRPEVSELLPAGPHPLTLPSGLFGELPFADSASGVRFSDQSGLPLFYGLTEAGFDLEVPKKAVSEGIEVEREFQIGGKTASQAKIGEKVQVHLKVRALHDQQVLNVALVDLLPAGFEVVVEHPAASAEGGRHRRGRGAIAGPRATARGRGGGRRGRRRRGAGGGHGRVHREGRGPGGGLRRRARGPRADLRHRRAQGAGAGLRDPRDQPGEGAGAAVVRGVDVRLVDPRAVARGELHRGGAVRSRLGELHRGGAVSAHSCVAPVVAGARSWPKSGGERLLPRAAGEVGWGVHERDLSLGGWRNVDLGDPLPASPASQGRRLRPRCPACLSSPRFGGRRLRPR